VSNCHWQPTLSGFSIGQSSLKPFKTARKIGYSWNHVLFTLQLPDILVSGLDNQLYVNGKFDWGGIIAHKMRAKFPQYGGSQGAPRDVKLAVLS